MIPALRACTFSNVEIEGDCCSALIDAKRRALAILHDCPAEVQGVTQKYNQLLTLPDISDLKYRQPLPEEWLACGIKALIEADVAASEHVVKLERYAATALEHAGRILKHRQGLQDGYQEHVTVAAATLEENRQKATTANVAKGKGTSQSIIDRIQAKIQERGNYSGIYADVAREMKVSRGRVSQVWKKHKPGNV